MTYNAWRLNWPQMQSSIRRKENDALKPEKQNSLVMYLGGEGGTRKSRIIKALWRLSEMCGRPGSARKCALTGTAASIGQGKTLNSLVLLRWKFDFCWTRSHRRRMLKKSWEWPCWLLTKYICSAAENLGALNCHLRQVTERNEVFGDVHVVLCGDLSNSTRFKWPSTLSQVPSRRQRRRKFAERKSYVAAVENGIYYMSQARA